ncbi:hypothetical protein Patl1_36769 [Pistacia atlantica]|nr:hypothetical protein Patl1_36769 [Pistacia atlantica]
MLNLFLILLMSWLCFFLHFSVSYLVSVCTWPLLNRGFSYLVWLLDMSVCHCHFATSFFSFCLVSVHFCWFYLYAYQLSHLMGPQKKQKTTKGAKSSSSKQSASSSRRSIIPNIPGAIIFKSKD